VKALQQKWIRKTWYIQFWNSETTHILVQF